MLLLTATASANKLTFGAVVSITTDAFAEIDPFAPGAERPSIAEGAFPEVTDCTMLPPFSSSAVADE